MIKGWDQNSKPWSIVWCLAVDYKGSAFRVQQMAVTLNFGTTDDHYQFEVFIHTENLADTVN